MKKLLLVVAGVVSLAGSVFAGAPVVIDNEEITTNEWKVTVGQVTGVILNEASLTTTNGSITIADSTGMRRGYFPVGVTNSTLTSSASIEYTGTSYSGNTADVTVVGSTFNAPNGMLNISEWSPNESWGEAAFFYATNSTFSVGQLMVRGTTTALFEDCTFIGGNGDGGFGTGSASYGSPEVTFRNSTITGWNPKLGRYAAPGTCLTIDGGTASFSGVSFYNSSPGKLVLTGGADVEIDRSSVTANPIWTFPDMSGCPQAEIHITDGATFNLKSDLTSPNMYTGVENYPSTVLRIDNGGVFDVQRMSSTFSIFHAINKSSADIQVGEEGTFRFYRLSLGYGDGGTTHQSATLHQTGGLVYSCGAKGAANVWACIKLAPDYCKNKDCIYYLDGGILRTPQIFGDANRYAAHPEYNNMTMLSADGGTIQPADVTYDSRVPYVIHSIDRVELGSKGLTADSCCSKANMGFNQGMTNKEGEEGLLRKIGAYDLTLSIPEGSTYDVTYTRVEEGALVIAGNPTLETTLTVTNGATLSLAGEATTLTVDNLVVNGGTLLLDAGDRVVVTGAAEIRDVTLAFATAPTEPMTNEILVVTEPLSELSVNALRSAAAAMTVPAGMMGRAVVETSGGTTTVKLTVQGDIAPLTEETTWKGATGDLWNDGANGWTDGVPTADAKAVFASEGSREVTVPAGAKAGALAFGDGFTLSGETLAMPTARGALTIATTAGETEIAAPLDLADEAKVTTAEGTALTLSGDVMHGGLIKDGAGQLVLAGANQFEYGLDFGAGTTVIADKDALGVVEGFGANDIRLANDTLRFRTADGGETVTKRTIRINTPEQRQAAVLCVDTPATVGGLVSEQGAIIKRGLAPLTVEVAKDVKITAKDASAGDYCQRFLTPIPADDGTVPANSGVAGEDRFLTLSVAEGELKFKAAPGATLPTVTANADATTIGVHTTNVTKRAVFALDGVKFLADSKDFFANGFNIGNDYATSPNYPFNEDTIDRLRNEVHLVNGAILHVGRFYENTYGTKQYFQPTVAMTNATLRAKTELWLSNSRSAKANVHLSAKSFYRVKDSALEGSLVLDGGVDGDFANTYVGPIDHTAYGTMKFTGPDFGTLLFRDGSVFRVATLNTSALDTRYALTLAFDGAEWQYGAGDYTFSPTLSAGMDAFFAFEARGKGLILKPTEGTTFTAAYPIGGTGGVVVDGPGTVKFNADMLAFTGAAVVRQGTLDAGGQAVAVMIEPGETVPTLKDCAAKGKIQVDMGGAAYEKGATFAVARISGSTPFRFKAVNFADPELYGYFTVQDGLVTMTVGDKPGLAIIVR